MQVWKIAKFQIKNAIFGVNKQDKSPSSLNVFKTKLVQQYLCIP